MSFINYRAIVISYERNQNMDKVTIFLMKILNIQNVYIINFICTIIIYIILKLFLKFINLINKKINLSEKTIYTINKKNKTFVTILFISLILCVWQNEIKNIITLISFISAAITLAARDIIFNYFCGIYIKITKPIKIEDRVKIGDITGDVININSLSFELLEVDLDTNQSTGKIIHISNSQIFNSSIKNYNTALKDEELKLKKEIEVISEDKNIADKNLEEITLNINLESDLNKAKKILLQIINSNEIIKVIPKKMEQEIKNSNSDYRIYYNKLTPIIYTKLEENKIKLSVRFLIHPKKQRNVESDIYEKIIIEFKKNNITLI